MAYPIIYTGKHSARLRLDEMAGRIADVPFDVRLWRFRFDIRNLVTPAAATSQEIDLTDVADVSNAKAFPTNVWMDGAWVHNVEDFAGGAISAMTAQVGDTGDPNGLLTASSVFTGVGAVTLRTTGAAQYALREEAAFVPTLTLTSTSANISAATAGILDIYIRYAKLHPAQF